MRSNLTQEELDDDVGHAIDVFFGKWILEKRKAMCMTTREASNRASVDFQRWKDIETGSRNKPVTHIECVKIASALGEDLELVIKKAAGSL